MDAINSVRTELGVAPTCAALGLPRATYYRMLKPKAPSAAKRAPPPRAPSVPTCVRHPTPGSLV